MRAYDYGGDDPPWQGCESRNLDYDQQRHPRRTERADTTVTHNFAPTDRGHCSKGIAHISPGVFMKKSSDDRRDRYGNDRHYERRQASGSAQQRGNASA